MRINIPILNCDNSATHFFRPKSEEIRERKIQKLSVASKTNNAGEDFFHYDHSEVELVDQLKLTKPTILRIKEPHAVAVLRDASPRLSLTVEFIEDLTPLLEHGLELQP